MKPMFRVVVQTVVTISLLITMPTAHARDAEGRYAVKGVGVLSCQTFLDQAKQVTPQAQVMVSWLDGYLSGINMLLEETYDLVTWQDGVLPNLLMSVCSQKPDQPIAIAAGQLVQLMAPQRLQSSETPETLTVGDSRRSMYPTVVKAMQQALKDNGHALIVDGDFGPGTQRALSAYQQSKGLPATGFPDPRTMVSLFASPPAP